VSVGRGFGTAAVAVCLVLAGCNDDSGSAPTIATLPPSLSSCDLPQSRADEQRCLDQIAMKVQTETVAVADGAPVTHRALSDVLTSTVQQLVGNGVSEYSYDSPIGDADVEEQATTPVRTTWRVGLTRTVLWACFSNGTVTVGTSACSGS
jgi:hypothetical protein